MPLFTQNGSLLRAGNSLRGCCCDDIEPPPPPPPPVPPGPEPPPPPIPPGDPPEFGGECCLINADGSDTGRAYCNDDELTIWYGKKSASLCGGKFVANLDGDHTCSDNREHGLRDEYITARFSVGAIPLHNPMGEVIGQLLGSGGAVTRVRSFYNRFASCSGDEVDDNARTPSVLRSFTCLAGEFHVNSRLVMQGETVSFRGMSFNAGPFNRNGDCMGTIDAIIPRCNQIPTRHPQGGTVGDGQPGMEILDAILRAQGHPAHRVVMIAAFAIVQVTLRLTWYHHDDYDIYASFSCQGGHEAVPTC